MSGRRARSVPAPAAVLAALLSLLAPLLLVPLHGTAHSQDPTVAPSTTVSADGRSVSGAGRSLSASQVHGLAPSGQAVTVAGSGYDMEKGIYVTLCAIPPTNQAPTPCAGGADRSGESGASGWVSSNPPSYAVGLTQPYGAGGTFTVTFTVAAQINDTIDCLSVRCAIVTRNDHTRGSDRSQDLFLPVTFARPSDPPPVTTAPAALPETTTTTAAPDPAAVPPAGVVASGGGSIGDGTRSVALSQHEALDPDGADVTVSGAGFDEAQGVYVALCAVPTAGGAPGPCATGEGVAAWVSSDPPEYGEGRTVPFAAGAFEVELHVTPVIDAEHDCRVVPCAIGTRTDDTAPADRRNDLFVPVSFADASLAAEVADDGAEAAVDLELAGEDAGSGGWGWRAVGAGAATVLVAGGAMGWRAQRRRGITP